MKKTLLTILMSLLFAVAINAQDVLRIPNNSYLVKFPVLTTDVVTEDGDIVEKIFDIGRKTDIQFYTISLDIDTTARAAELMNHKIPVTLEGSWDNGSTYSAISTVNFYGTADTTFVFQDISTGTTAPLLKVKLNGADADSVSVQLIGLYGRFINKQ